MMFNKFVQQLVFLIGFLLSAFSVNAAVAVPAPPIVAASAYILQDFNSGYIIAEQNIDKRLEVASLTKMMTAYVVFKALRTGQASLDDQVHVSEKAWKNPGVKGWMKASRMFLNVHSKVPLEALIRGLLVQSGNDAAVALAEHIAGSEDDFVEYMNQYAAILEMNNTHYSNSTGWPDKEQYSTVRDIVTLSSALIREFPEYYHYFSEKRFTYNNIAQTNRNTLLWKDESVDGIKTGRTENAGYCLVSSASRDNMRLISVVVGANDDRSRTKISKSLLDYGYRFYETNKLFAVNETIRQARVWKGAESQLNLGVKHDLYITTPRGEYENLQATIDIQRSIVAPVRKNDIYGRINIDLYDENVLQQPLVALHEIDEGNIIKKVFDQVLKVFK